LKYNDKFGIKLKSTLEKGVSSFFNIINSIIDGGDNDCQKISEKLIANLIKNGISYDISQKIVDEAYQKQDKKKIDIVGFKQSMFQQIESIIRPYATPLELDCQKTPQVIVFCGLNGSGKTTTIVKMSHMLNKYNWKVTIAGCDNYKLSADEQLKEVCEKYKIPFITNEKKNESPSDTACRGYLSALENQSDVLLIDTAGRMKQTENLLLEIKKIEDDLRVIQMKYKGFVNQNNVIVVDSSSGNNAIEQIVQFKKYINIDGIVLSKLDYLAKAGFVVSLIDKLKIKVYGIGIGQGEEDLQDFDSIEFAQNLTELEL
jgi:fused signal recognition particle receptor